MCFNAKKVRTKKQIYNKRGDIQKKKIIEY